MYRITHFPNTIFVFRASSTTERKSMLTIPLIMNFEVIHDLPTRGVIRVRKRTKMAGRRIAEGCLKA